MGVTFTIPEVLEVFHPMQAAKMVLRLEPCDGEHKVDNFKAFGDPVNPSLSFAGVDDDI